MSGQACSDVYTAILTRLSHGPLVWKRNGYGEEKACAVIHLSCGDVEVEFSRQGRCICTVTGMTLIDLEPGQLADPFANPTATNC